MKTAFQFGVFAAVSVLSFVLDWSVFSALVWTLPPDFPARLFAAVAVARCISVVFNYSCNRFVVFGRAGRCGGTDRDAGGESGRGGDIFSVRGALSRSFPRYVALAVALLVGSWALLKAFHAALPGFPLYAAKPVVDALLFFLSFWVQKKFVFSRCASSSK